ncbi:nucleotidyltransferase family protein [Pseudotabrizicola sp.]|uniref:nucleotidyltransferase family protein n=1 Tax=Pseudotabrizicola sp. TaxID=2939647 RepID=UPI00271E82D9|nr:nucleotidyltransferase family protein [Pseudotabrizicola sp.]MDO8882976.1 nucleotidyltransferase family protein [Pseudotabrizicola sp.]
MPKPPLHILILAAGASSRMGGGDKLLEQVDGQALLRQVAQRALASGFPVNVALAPDRPGRGAALAGLALTRVTVSDPGEGMAASLRAGLCSLPEDASVMLMLADLPEITTEDLTQMAQAHAATPEMILRATDAAGQPGHPVVFPAWVRGDLMALGGDDGARAVLRAHSNRLRLIALPDQHATTDLDTPEAWAQWRLGRE